MAKKKTEKEYEYSVTITASGDMNFKVVGSYEYVEKVVAEAIRTLEDPQRTIHSMTGVEGDFDDAISYDYDIEEVDED